MSSSSMVTSCRCVCNQRQEVIIIKLRGASSSSADLRCFVDELAVHGSASEIRTARA